MTPLALKTCMAFRRQSRERPAGRAGLRAVLAPTGKPHVGMSRLAFEVIRNKRCLRYPQKKQKSPKAGKRLYPTELPSK